MHQVDKNARGIKSLYNAYILKNIKMKNKSYKNIYENYLKLKNASLKLL